MIKLRDMGNTEKTHLKFLQIKTTFTKTNSRLDTAEEKLVNQM